MKPLIFEFQEPATGPDVDFSPLEYSEELNLSINRETGDPAIRALSMITVTRSKSLDTSSDVDKDDVSILMETETRTFTKTESSDSDRDRFALEADLITMTATRQMIESSDSDV